MDQWCEPAQERRDVFLEVCSLLEALRTSIAGNSSPAIKYLPGHYLLIEGVHNQSSGRHTARKPLPPFLSDQNLARN